MPYYFISSIHNFSLIKKQINLDIIYNLFALAFWMLFSNHFPSNKWIRIIYGGGIFFYWTLFNNLHRAGSFNCFRKIWEYFWRGKRVFHLVVICLVLLHNKLKINFSNNFLFHMGKLKLHFMYSSSWFIWTIYW